MFPRKTRRREKSRLQLRVACGFRAAAPAAPGRAPLPRAGAARRRRAPPLLLLLPRHRRWRRFRTRAARHRADADTAQCRYRARSRTRPRAAPHLRRFRPRAARCSDGTALEPIPPRAAGAPTHRRPRIPL
jgi:hypothetical protein